MALVIVVGGYAAIFIYSVVLHEIAHGVVAYWCGDPTAYLMGRLTLNPIKHVDPFMTLIVPAICLFTGMPIFGGAKPVPVNPYNLKRAVLDRRLVSVAGVVVNLTLAWVLAAALHLLLWTKVFTPNSLGTAAIGMGIFTNLVLFIFNLIPVPPLDGSRLLRTFLGPELQQLFNMLDRWGLLILVLLIQVPLFNDLLFRGLYYLWVYLLRFDDATMIHVFRTFSHAIGR